MTIQKNAWQEAGWVFVLSRMVILVVSYVGSARFPLNERSPVPTCSVDFGTCLLAWQHWDVFSYMSVAQNGYAHARATAFFPLWPLLLRAAAVLFGSSTLVYYIAGLLLANLFFYLALVIFYALLDEEFESTVARNALYYLAFYPYALFFFAGYTESLFLLLCLAVFFFLQRGLKRGLTLDWWLAGLCGFLAALTRSPGVVLGVPFLVVFLQRFWLYGNFAHTSWRQKLQALAPIVLIPLGVATYMLYLGYTKGNPLLFSTEEAASWNRHLSAPWLGVFFALQGLFVNSPLHILNVLDLAFTLIPLLALIAGFRRIPAHYALFSLVMVLFSLAYPQGTTVPLTAVPRYMMVIFPIIVIFAQWGKHPRFDKLFMAFSVALFAINIVLFISHYWVA
ncbi:MAG: hypothetical protein PVSMB5_28900 [Ktedonobacteraceae bacterium]